VSLAGHALELERSSPDALLHMIVQRTVSSRSRSGAQKTAPQLPKLLHELLHDCFPERPETHKNHFEAPLLHNDIRKVGSFRNRQVSGSSPLVGSILSNTYKPFHCTSNSL
jgi:hypothetical protein